MIKAIRCAILLDKNDKDEIDLRVRDLFKGVLNNNKLKEKNILSIIFSQTPDITDKNPATALRAIGFKDVPLFCTQEPVYNNSIPLMLRALVFVKTFCPKKVKPVYMNGAEKLRKDLFNDE